VGSRNPLNNGIWTNIHSYTFPNGGLTPFAKNAPTSPKIKKYRIAGFITSFLSRRIIDPYTKIGIRRNSGRIKCVNPKIFSGQLGCSKASVLENSAQLKNANHPGSPYPAGNPNERAKNEGNSQKL
jgi:hypothetical protein